MAFHESSSLGGNKTMIYPYLQQYSNDDHNYHHIPNYNYQPQKSHQHNIHLPSSAVLITHPPEKSDGGGGGTSNNKNKNNNEYKLKRILHRDIERQRRQEMANLYASLRSLLPLEYIKGKRSISDHMQEAVNYIKYLENRIGEFRHRRNKLQIVNNSSGSSSPEKNTGKSVQTPTATTFSPNSSSFVVTVNPCLPDCLEILIGSNNNNNNNTAGAVFPLSRVLKKLVNDELGFSFNVVSCISTQVNDRLVHKIVAQVNDSKCIDNMEQLQEKLKNVLSENFSI